MPVPAASGPAGTIAEPVVSAPAGSPECPALPPLSLLVIGSDTRNHDYASGRADFIRAVRVDPAARSVRLLAVPRDLYVPIGAAQSNLFLDRINTAYSYGNLSGKPGGGPSLLAATLHHNFGLSFERYLVINFDAFVDGINAIGGVDLTLPNAVDGTRQGLRAFPAGPQHLDGAALLDYVRVRYIDSDVHRGQRQDEVIKALRSQVQQPGAYADVPGLALALSRLVQTDLSAEEIVGLACLGRHWPEDALNTYRIGWNEVTPHTTSEGAQVLLPRMDRVMAVIAAFTAP